MPQHCSTVIAAATSLSTCLPARSASIAIGAWTCIGVPRITASRSSRCEHTAIVERPLGVARRLASAARLGDHVDRPIEVRLFDVAQGGHVNAGRQGELQEIRSPPADADHADAQRRSLLLRPG